MFKTARIRAAVQCPGGCPGRRLVRGVCVTMDDGEQQYDLVIRLYEGRNLRRVPTKRQAVVVQCNLLGLVRAACAAVVP